MHIYIHTLESIEVYKQFKNPTQFKLNNKNINDKKKNKKNKKVWTEGDSNPRIFRYVNTLGVVIDQKNYEFLSHAP